MQQIPKRSIKRDFYDFLCLEFKTQSTCSGAADEHFLLLSIAEATQQTSIHKAIVEIFSIDSNDLQEWLHCEVMSHSSESDEVTTNHQGIVALQKFINCAMQEREYVIFYILSLFLLQIKGQSAFPLDCI